MLLPLTSNVWSFRLFQSSFSGRVWSPTDWSVLHGGMRETMAGTMSAGGQRGKAGRPRKQW